MNLRIIQKKTYLIIKLSQLQQLNIDCSKMLKKIIYIFIILIVIQAKLQYVYSMIRDGASYSKYDSYNEKKTTDMKNYVTTVGMRQLYNLGSYVKQIYINEEKLTTTKFAPSQVQFYSQTLPRTHTSALSFINGLFPLNEGWTIPQQITPDKFNPPYTPLFSSNLKSSLNQEQFALTKGFQPWPVRPLDDILNNCPDYDYLFAKRQLQIKEKTSILELQLATQIKRLKTIFNLTVEQATISSLSDLYQDVQANRYLGKALPLDYTQNDQKTHKYIFQKYRALSLNGRFAKIIITANLKMIREKLKNSAKNQTTNRLTFVTCQSDNLWPLATQLNLTSPECIAEKFYNKPLTSLNCVDVKYASNLFLELHNQTDALYVKVRYNGQYVNLCQTRSTKCSYEEFTLRLAQIEQSNYQSECKIIKQIPVLAEK